MKTTTLLVGGLGIALAVGLIVNFNTAEIGAALASVGVRGAFALALYRLVPVALCAWAWQILAPRPSGLPPLGGLRARLVREGVGGLLPLMPAGGEIVGARMLALEGLPAATAAAATIADVTMETASQAVFTFFGAAAMAAIGSGGGLNHWALAGLAVSVPMAGGLAAIQHPKVLAALERWARRLVTGAWAGWVGENGLRRALGEVYGRRRAVAASFLAHLAAWIIGAGESWVALHLMGRPLSLPSVLALEALVFAIRSAAFFVPWSAGVQEGGYLALGAAVGLPPEAALTLSLVRRLPEIIVGVPGLALWHRGETVWRQKQAVAEPAE